MSLLASPFVRRLADSAFARYAQHRYRRIDHANPARVQEQTLLSLVRRAEHTKFGRDHYFRQIRTVSDYQKRVPLRTYEQFWDEYWKAPFPNLAGVTWPTPIPYYALSSGTTSGATKYIPISPEMSASNRKAGLTTAALFRERFPNHSLLNGQIFFLGGSTEFTRQSDGSFAGDLSAIAGLESPAWMKPLIFPPPEIARLTNWDEKAQKLAETSAHLPITAISGVPAWILVIFDRLKKVTGKATIAEIWPLLRLVIHGGTSFEPYREVFRREIGSDQVEFLETYPCSEGFIATEDPKYKLLQLVFDHDIFFEFVPARMGDNGLKLDQEVRHTVKTLETGQLYSIALTTCAGLWSYLVGDTVIFEKSDPLLLRFAGRTKDFLSAFGEHLIGEEVAKAVGNAATALGLSVHAFHVGPVFPEEPNKPGHHRYLIEFEGAKPGFKVLDEFSRRVDESLNEQNEDYRAHRNGDLSMLRPEIITVAEGGFLAWRLSRGGRAEQGKAPMMDNTGKLTGEICEWLKANNPSEPEA